MVRGIEFVRERSAPGRYIATLNVVFQPDPVKAWLGQAGVKIAETVSRAALVIPLWKGKAGVEPLDDRNAWREAWRALDTAGSAVPVTVLRGDQLDQNAVTAEELYVGDVSALARLNERYRAPTIVVAIVEGDKDSGPLTVGGLRYDAQTGARSEIPRTTVPDSSQLADRGQADPPEARRAVAQRRHGAPRFAGHDRRLCADPGARRLGAGAPAAGRRAGAQGASSCASSNPIAPSCRLEYFGTTDELQRTLASAGLALDKEADKWRLQVR